jgi:hypothetical protein
VAVIAANQEYRLVLAAALRFCVPVVRHWYILRHFHGISVRRRDASLNGADFAQDVKTAVT